MSLKEPFWSWSLGTLQSDYIVRGQHFKERGGNNEIMNVFRFFLPILCILSKQERSKQRKVCFPSFMGFLCVQSSIQFTNMGTGNHWVQMIPFHFSTPPTKILKFDDPLSCYPYPCVNIWDDRCHTHTSTSIRYFEPSCAISKHDKASMPNCQYHNFWSKIF